LFCDQKSVVKRLSVFIARKGTQIMSYKSLIHIQFVALATVLAGPVQAQAGPVDVNIYSTIADSPTGITYSNFVGAFSVNEIQFASATGYNWHPFGLTTNFGAYITGTLAVESPGTYSFTLNSDAGSRLFIDNVMVVDNGGNHGPMTVTSSKLLSAGIHPFELQFKETGGGESGVDLNLPEGVRFYGAIENPQAPEPTGIALFGVGVFGLLGYRLRRRHPQAEAISR
jgi:hypothetical protein